MFQARFRSILVEKDSHLLTTARYIVLNPVRAGLCASPGEWRWSSYGALAGIRPVEPFLCTDCVLGQFGRTRRAAQAAYREFVAAALDEALEESVRGERLGTDDFLRETFGLDPPLPEIPREQIEPLRPPLAEIFAARSEPIVVAYREHGYGLREIAEFLGCHYSTVSRRMRQEEERLLHSKT